MCVSWEDGEGREGEDGKGGSDGWRMRDGEGGSDGGRRMKDEREEGKSVRRNKEDRIERDEGGLLAPLCLSKMWCIPQKA